LAVKNTSFFKKEDKVMNIVLYVFLIFVFFPYIKYFNIGLNTDVQIYAFVLGFFICIANLIINHNNIDKIFIKITAYITFILIVLLAISLYKSNNVTIFNFLRGIYPYVSLAIIPWATSILLSKFRLNYIEKILKCFYWIWVIVGTIQLINPKLLSGWRDRAIITDDRGAISLASEPAYFIIMLILITLILLIINYQRNKKFIIFNIIVSILVAQNAVGLIYSILLLIVMNIHRLTISRILNILIGLVLFSIGVYILVVNNPDARLSYLIINIVQHPFQVVFEDPSLNIRFAHLYLSFKGAFQNFLLPNGVTEWGQYYYYNVLANRELFIEPLYRLQNSSNKIVTMHGGFIYEIGILAVPMYIFFFNKIKKIKLGNELFTHILILGLNGLNASNPAFGFLVGLILHKYKGGTNVDTVKNFV